MSKSKAARAAVAEPPTDTPISASPGAAGGSATAVAETDREPADPRLAQLTAELAPHLPEWISGADLGDELDGITAGDVSRIDKHPGVTRRYPRGGVERFKTSQVLRAIAELGLEVRRSQVNLARGEMRPDEYLSPQTVYPVDDLPAKLGVSVETFCNALGLRECRGTIGGGAILHAIARGALKPWPCGHYVRMGLAKRRREAEAAEAAAATERASTTSAAVARILESQQDDAEQKRQAALAPLRHEYRNILARHEALTDNDHHRLAELTVEMGALGADVGPEQIARDIAALVRIESLQLQAQTLAEAEAEKQAAVAHQKALARRLRQEEDDAKRRVVQAWNRVRDCKAAPSEIENIKAKHPLLFQ